MILNKYQLCTHFALVEYCEIIEKLFLIFLFRLRFLINDP